MSTPVLIIILVLLLGIGLFFYKHSHHPTIAGDTEKLRATIQQIFKEAEKSPLSQNRLIKELKQKFHVNEKVALTIISKARRENIINVVDGNCTLAE